MFTIRKATTDDIALIHQMATIAFPHTYSELLSPEQIDFMMEWMYSPKNLHKQMTEDGHIYYIASDADGTPAAYLSIQPEAEDVWHLQKIYILPPYKGQGLGRTLFEHAAHTARQLNGRPCELHLNVNRYNTRAVEFYRHMGMECIFEGDFDIGHGYLMTDYIMCLRIR